MPRKIENLKRVTRTRRLTDEEAEIAQRKRDAAQDEAPEVIAKFRAEQAGEIARQRTAQQAAKILGDLKIVRESQKLTLQEVADRVGMDVSNVAKLESGQRENPTLETLVRLAHGLGKQVQLTLVDK